MSGSFPAAAICIEVPLDDALAQARTVFVATIRSSTTRPEVGALSDGQRYQVVHAIDLAVRFKGDASIVPALTTYARFDDPADDVFWTQAEETRLVPGDNVLVVVTEPGDVAVSSIGCTASRPWTDETAREVRSHFRITD